MKVLEINSSPKGNSDMRCIGFTYNDWRLLFDAEFICFWISRILNGCHKPDGLKIRGYLVGDEITYLILEGEPKVLHQFYRAMNSFTKSMLDGYLRLEKNRSQDIRLYFEKINNDKTPMYQRVYFRNKDYIHVLLNEPFDFRFHNYSFLVFYQDARSSRFCSRLDYEGGSGPVIIDKVHRTIHIQKESH